VHAVLGAHAAQGSCIHVAHLLLEHAVEPVDAAELALPDQAAHDATVSSEVTFSTAVLQPARLIKICPAHSLGPFGPTAAGLRPVDARAKCLHPVGARAQWAPSGRHCRCACVDQKRSLKKAEHGALLSNRATRPGTTEPREQGKKKKVAPKIARRNPMFSLVSEGYRAARERAAPSTATRTRSRGACAWMAWGIRSAVCASQEARGRRV